VTGYRQSWGAEQIEAGGQDGATGRKMGEGSVEPVYRDAAGAEESDWDCGNRNWYSLVPAAMSDTRSVSVWRARCRWSVGRGVVEGRRGGRASKVQARSGSAGRTGFKTEHDGR